MLAFALAKLSVDQNARNPVINNPIRGVTLVLLAAVLWGTTGTAQSFAPLSMSSYWVGAARLIIAGGFFILWLSISNARQLSPQSLSALPLKLILIAAASMAIYNLAFFAGVRASGVALGTALALGSGPLWAGLFQVLWYRHMPRPAWWLAVTIATSGLFIATLGNDESSSQLPLSGIALCLASGLSYAVYAITTKQIVAVAPAATTTAVVFTLAAVFATPMALLLADLPRLGWSDISPLLWLGVIATGVAYLLFSNGLRHISSATGVALALAEPVAAVVLAIVIVGERPTLLSLAGMLIVFTGLIVLVKSELATEHKKSELATEHQKSELATEHQKSAG